MKRLTTFLMALLLIAFGASAQSWTAPELPTSTLTTAGGNYYLYNTEAERFMGIGTILWGTEATFSETGFLATLTYDESSEAYTIYNNGGNSGYVFRDGNYLYVNGSTASDATNYARRFFSFTATTGGTYTIQTAWTEDDYSGYLGYDAQGTTENEIKTTLTSTDTGIYWELIAEDAEELYDALVILYNTLIHAESYGMTADSDEAYKSAGEVYLSSTATADEVMAAVAALEVAMEEYASEEDPDDVTYAYITNPDFDSYSGDTFTGWTNDGMTSQTSNIFTNGDITISVYPEKWTQTTSTLANAKISQVLADLPKGTYRLEADAIAVNQGTTTLTVSGVYLYASSPMTSMTSVHTGDAAPEHFTVIFEVAEGGTSVDIGFKVSGTDASWVAVDNFRLYYLSSEVTTVLTDTKSDYSEGDVATIYGHKYNVKSDNMVENHSFELGLDGWTDANSHNTITSEKFELRSDGAQDGNVYLVGTTNEGSSNASGSLCTGWAIEAGKTYYFSYYVKGLTSVTDGGYLRTDIVEELGGESDGVIFATPTVTTEWQKIEYLFTNTDYNLLQIEFRWLNNQWGFDNFQLYQVEPAEDVLDDSEYKTGDEVTVSDVMYTVKSENMFVNGGFNADMYGWTAGGYFVAADPDNFNVQESGGFNEGAYLFASSAGTSSVQTPSQAIAVEEGKTYLFIGYTSGTTPEGERYSALFEMSDATTEANHTESDDQSYGNTIIQLEWGAETGETSEKWTQTIGVFEATTDYVGMRMGWSGGSYDGFQLYEVEATGEEIITWEMTTAGWATLILPFDGKLTDGLEAYTCSGVDEDGTLILSDESTSEVKANTPYIIKGSVDKDTTYEFSGTPVEDMNDSEGPLVGTFETLNYEALAGIENETSSTVYLLQNHQTTDTDYVDGEGTGIGFYPVNTSSENTGVTLGAYHCYLTLPSGSSGVRAYISLPDSGEETGIVAVEGDVIANDAIYDLSGRRVAKAVKGVYIQNGKKVLVK